MEVARQDKMEWLVHTPMLLKEIGSMTGTGFGILSRPLQIFGLLLFEVGEVAARINDPELNYLMARLTIYSISDPSSPDYNKDWRKIIKHQLDIIR